MGSEQGMCANPTGSKYNFTVLISITGQHPCKESNKIIPIKVEMNS
jgi:hypothetical protein